MDFSIIIPTYNRSEKLKSAIQSLLDQSFQNWECIVVDDGSTDNTREEVTALAEKDHRIKYTYQDNAERSAARNNGIAHATGEYICFLDSDDTYLPNYLADLNEAIDQLGRPVAMFESAVSRMTEGVLTHLPIDDLSNYYNVLEYLLLTPETVIPPRVTIHRDILKQHKFNEALNISEDTELFTRIVLEYPYHQLTVVGPVYHIHDENSTNISKNPFEGQLKSLRTIFSDPIRKKQISRRARKIKLGSCYHGITKYHLSAGNFWKVRYYALRSMLNDSKLLPWKNKLMLLLAPKRTTVSRVQTKGYNIPENWGISEAELNQIFQAEMNYSKFLRTETDQTKRKALYSYVYSEYFKALPFHPQFKIKLSPEIKENRIKYQTRLLSPYLDEDISFMEIGAGDCSLSLSLADRTAQIYAMEVSQEIIADIDFPENVDAQIFDGFVFPFEDNSIDLAFSNQLLEHLHPEDAVDQLKDILRVLKKDGKYVCITPNRISGPHDISRFFTDELMTFHLKEYSRFELIRLFKKVGFKKAKAYAIIRDKKVEIPTWMVWCTETFIGLFGPKLRRKLSSLPYIHKIIDAPVVGIK